MADYRGKRIKVFRNGDAFSAPKKVVLNLRFYRNFEQLLHSLSSDINLLNGAVRKLYTIDGSVVHQYDEIVEGGMYVAAGNESFKKVMYKVSSARTSIAPADGASVMTRRTNFTKRSKAPAPSFVTAAHERGIFDITSKGYWITVFANGDDKKLGRKLLINFRNCRTFDQLIAAVTPVSGLSYAVRKLYNAIDGARILHLADLQDGMNIVASGIEAYKKVEYPIERVHASASLEDPPRVITIYPNGDTMHNGLKLTITRHRFRTLQRFLEHIGQHIELVTGLAKQIYTLTGHKIHELRELEGGQAYVVAADGELFIRCEYNLNQPLKALVVHPPQAAGLGPSNSPKKIFAIKAEKKMKEHKMEVVSAVSDDESDGGVSFKSAMNKNATIRRKPIKEKKLEQNGKVRDVSKAETNTMRVIYDEAIPEEPLDVIQETKKPAHPIQVKTPAQRLFTQEPKTAPKNRESPVTATNTIAGTPMVKSAQQPNFNGLKFSATSSQMAGSMDEIETEENTRTLTSDLKSVTSFSKLGSPAALKSNERNDSSLPISSPPFKTLAQRSNEKLLSATQSSKGNDGGNLSLSGSAMQLAPSRNTDRQTESPALFSAPKDNFVSNNNDFDSRESLKMSKSNNASRNKIGESSDNVASSKEKLASRSSVAKLTPEQPKSKPVTKSASSKTRSQSKLANFGSDSLNDVSGLLDEVDALMNSSQKTESNSGLAHQGQ